jgi:Tol biopolymer transport system component
MLALSMGFCGASTSAQARSTEKPADAVQAESDQIAYTCAGSSGIYQICLMTSDGTLAHQISDFPYPTVTPFSWSHAGDRIAMSLGGMIYTMNADGSNLTKLSRGTGISSRRDSTPDWSPDDKTIIFSHLTSSASPQTGSIMMMSAIDGSNRSTLLATNGSLYGSPHYAPDGSYIIFVDTTGGEGGNWSLWKMGPTGLNPTRFVSIDGVIFDPAISPDGTKIAVQFAYATGATASDLNIGVLNSDGTNLHPITNLVEPMEAADPNWSPDGEKITFEIDDCSGLDRATCESEENPAAPANVFTINPDGTDIYATGQSCIATECSPRFRP